MKLITPLIMLALGSAAYFTFPAKADDASLAAYLVSHVANSNGICSLPRCPSGSLAVEMKKASGFIVHAQHHDAAIVDEIRSAADAENTLGQRIYVDKSNVTNIPFAKKYIDLMAVTDVTDSGLSGISIEEITRVLSPNGKAILCNSGEGTLTESTVSNWLAASPVANFDFQISSNSFGTAAAIVRHRDSGEDDWSYWYHGSDNNPVSTDSEVKFPYLSQFFAKPFHSAAPECVVMANGRVFRTMGTTATFSAMDEAERRDDYCTIEAHNGYNGQPLWRKKFPAMTTHKHGYIATDDTYYMIYSNKVLFIDAATGEDLDYLTFPGELQFPKWIGIENNKLVVMSGIEDLPRLTVGKGRYVFDPFGVDHTGVACVEPSWGKGQRIAAYDLATKNLLWEHSEPSLIYSRNIGMFDEKIFFHAVGTNHWGTNGFFNANHAPPWPDGWSDATSNTAARIGCLSMDDGSVLWENTDPAVIADANEYKGTFGHRLARARMGMLCTSNYLFICRSGSKYLVTLSALTGNFLWKAPWKSGRSIDALFLNNKLYEQGLEINGSNNRAIVNPETGARIEDISLAKVGCARMTVSPDAIYTAGGRGQDLKTGTKTDGANGFKSGCNSGTFTANGSLYSIPTRCGCNVSARGFVAVGYAGDNFDFGPAADADRLETTANTPAASVQVTDKDWFTYRKENNRSAYSPTSVGTISNIFWIYSPNTTNIPVAAIAVGDYTYVAGDDGKVRCINIDNGSEEWAFSTGGKIMAAPTVWSNRVFVGSSDGCVYSLDASNGNLLWKYRLAPHNRKMMIYDHLASTWPVNSGVIINDGVAYAAAGMLDWDGTHVFALNATTGEKIWQNSDSAFVNKISNKGISAAGYLTILNNKLWMPSGNYCSPASYDLTDGAASNSIYGFKVALRGKEIAVYGTNHLAFGGFMMHGRDNEWFPCAGVDIAFLKIDQNGQRDYNEVYVNTLGNAKAKTRLMPAWDWNDTFACIEGAAILASWDTHQMIDIITDAKTNSSTKHYSYLDIDNAPQSNATNWKKGNNNVHLYGHVLADDQLVVLYGDYPGYSRLSENFWISGLSRSDGSELWKVDLPGEPIIAGLAINKDGTIVVPLIDGRVVALQSGVVAVQASSSNVSVPEGGTVNFSIKLGGEPDHTVTVDVSRISGDSDISVSGQSQFYFSTADYGTFQDVTLAAAHDGDRDNSTAIIRCQSDDASSVDITATEIDDDEFGIVTSVNSTHINEGGTAGFSVKLDNDPGAGNTITVSVYRASGDTDISVSGGSTLFFHSGNFSAYQNVTLIAATDTDTTDGIAIINCEAPECGSVSVTATEIDSAVRIQTSDSSIAVPEGGTNSFEVKLDKIPENNTTVTVSRVSGDSDITVSNGVSLVFTTANYGTYQPVIIAAAEDSDSNEGSATIRCSAPLCASADVTATEIENEGVSIALQDGDNGYSGTLDSYISSYGQDSNYGLVEYGYIEPDRQSVVKWDLTSVPNTAHVDSVSITLTIKKSQPRYSNSFELTTYALKTPWTELGVTWNTSDGVTPWTAGLSGSSDRDVLAATTQVPKPVSSDKIQLIINLNDDGIAYIQDCINDPSTNFGFIFDNEDNTERRNCYLRETDIVSERPKITINYIIESPDPPDNPSVNINNGESQTTNNVVSLVLYAENPTPVNMQISEDSNFTGTSWIDYTTDYEFTLSPVFETKTVFAQFSDGKGGISDAASDSINYVPEISIIGNLVSVIGTGFFMCRKYK